MHDKTHIVSLLFLLLFSFLAPLALFGQVKSDYSIRLQWKGVVEEHYANDTILYIGLESGEYESPMPIFSQSFPIYDDAVKAEVKCLNVKTAALSDEEMQIARNYSYGSDFEMEVLPIRSRNESFLSVRIVPFRQLGAQYEKLLSATLSVTLVPEFGTQKNNPGFKTSSAMSTSA